MSAKPSQEGKVKKTQVTRAQRRRRGCHPITGQLRSMKGRQGRQGENGMEAYSESMAVTGTIKRCRASISHGEKMKGSPVNQWKVAEQQDKERRALHMDEGD